MAHLYFILMSTIFYYSDLIYDRQTRLSDEPKCECRWQKLSHLARNPLWGESLPKTPVNTPREPLNASVARGAQRDHIPLLQTRTSPPLYGNLESCQDWGAFGQWNTFPEARNLGLMFLTMDHAGTQYMQYGTQCFKDRNTYNVSKYGTLSTYVSKMELEMLQSAEHNITTQK